MRNQNAIGIGIVTATETVIETATVIGIVTAIEIVTVIVTVTMTEITTETVTVVIAVTVDHEAGRIPVAMALTEAVMTLGAVAALHRGLRREGTGNGNPPRCGMSLRLVSTVMVHDLFHSIYCVDTVSSLQCPFGFNPLRSLSMNPTV